MGPFQRGRFPVTATNPRLRTRVVPRLATVGRVFPARVVARMVQPSRVEPNVVETAFIDPTNVSVQSSFIASIGYEPSGGGSGDLVVNIDNGGALRSYVYQGVAEHVFHEMLNAGSKGKFFNREVKGKYTWHPRS